jgi:hypothetical protein
MLIGKTGRKKDGVTNELVSKIWQVQYATSSPDYSSWPSRFRLIILGGNRQGRLTGISLTQFGYFAKLTARKFMTACNSPALGRPGTRLPFPHMAPSWPFYELQEQSQLLNRYWIFLTRILLKMSIYSDHILWKENMVF